MGFKLIVMCFIIIYTCIQKQQVNANTNTLDLSDLTNDDIEAILGDIMNRRKLNNKKAAEKCKFEQGDGYIIKASDSIKNGAAFITPPSIANTSEDCRNECCDNEICDFAVFQSVTTSPEKSDNKPTQCYLFNCTFPNGEFVCKTAKHTDYITFTKDLKYEHETDLLDMASHISTTESTTTKLSTTTTQLATTTSSTTTVPTSTTTVLSTLSTTLPSTTASATTSTTKSTTTTAILPSSVQVEVSTTTIQPKTSSLASTVKLQASGKCLMALDKGTCKEKMERFYFDIELNSCEQFVYTGCGGNDNNFESAEICQLTCDEFFTEYTDTDESVILPLALGLMVTASVLLMVACRLRVMKRKLKYRGKPLSMDESDYLVNGMYL